MCISRNIMPVFQCAVGHRDGAAGDLLRGPHRGRHVPLPLTRSENFRLRGLRRFGQGEPYVLLTLFLCRGGEVYFLP